MTSYPGQYVTSVNQCAECPAGTYSPSSSGSTCIACGPNTMAFQGSTSCQTCYTNAQTTGCNSTTGSGLSCNAGYGVTPGQNQLPCQTCPLGTTSWNNSTLCLSCSLYQSRSCNGTAPVS